MRVRGKEVAIRHIGAVLMALTLIGGATGALADGPRPGAPWATFKRDGTGMALAGNNGPQTLALKWTANADGGVSGGPVIGDDGVVYVTTDNRKLVGVRPDGSRRFTFTAETGVNGKYGIPLVNSKNRVVFATEDGWVIGVNTDGKEGWRFDTRGAQYGDTEPQTITAPPMASGNYGRILVPTYKALVYELDDGAFAGVRRADGSIRAGAVIASDGTLVWATTDKSVYGGAAGGGDKWRVTVDGAVLVTPATSKDGVVFVATDTAGLFAFRTSDGTKLWNVKVGTAALKGSPTVGPDGTLYVGSDDGKLYAIDPKTGAQKWAFGTGGSITSAAAIGANGLIYLGSTDSSLYVITPDGKQQSSFKTGGLIDVSAPAIGSDGIVYVGSRDGKLYAFGEGGTRSHGRPSSSSRPCGPCSAKCAGSRTCPRASSCPGTRSGCVSAGFYRTG